MLVQANDSLGLYQDLLGDVFIEPWVQFDEHYSDREGWECSEPRRSGSASPPYFLEQLGRSWDLLALSSVVRDRWFPRAWRRLVGLGA
jgi:hypothetical protein